MLSKSNQHPTLTDLRTMCLILQVVVGSSSLSQNGELYSVSDIQVHQQPFQNNLAVLRMYPVREAATYILLQKKSFATNYNSILSGWGGINKTLCNHLQFLAVEWLDSVTCSNKYNLELKEQHHCGVINGNEGVCVGDDGSPLITYNFMAQIMRLIGIMNYSDMCTKQYPILFTNVSLYVSWIRSKCNNCVLF
ncbi:hypothetical protein FQR65_LT12356 [Abscondita terminalis]|nr:hypothetical protein FQR65_LT12356 [Abscondita terminalis]